MGESLLPPTGDKRFNARVERELSKVTDVARKFHDGDHDDLNGPIGEISGMPQQTSVRRLRAQSPGDDDFRWFAKHCCGVDDSMLDEDGKLPVGRLRFPLAWFQQACHAIALNQGIYTLADVLNGMVTDRTCRNWMNRGTRYLKSPPEDRDEKDRNFACVALAIWEGQRRAKRELERTASGQSFPYLAPKDRMRGAQFQLARIDKAEDEQRNLNVQISKARLRKERAQANAAEHVEAILSRLRCELENEPAALGKVMAYLEQGKLPEHALAALEGEKEMPLALHG